MINRLAKAGKPLACALVINDWGLADAIKVVSPSTFVVFRWVDGVNDPNPANSGWPTGEWWFNKMWARHSQCKLADAHQMTNEWLTNGWDKDTTARFCKFYVELMDAAAKRGVKVTVGDFYPGTPEVLTVNGRNQLEELAPMFLKAEQLGMPVNYHCYSLSEETMNDPEQWSSERWVRFQMRYPRLRLFFGEGGTFTGDFYPAKTLRLIKEMDVLMRNYPNVLGICWWTANGSVLNGWAEDNINPILGDLEAWLLS